MLRIWSGSNAARMSMDSCFIIQDDLSCSEKLVISVTVENGKIHETDYLDFAVDCVGSPTGKCPCGCTYTVDENCMCRDLSSPIRVSIVRTPVKIQYPLEEPTAFNGRPHEVRIGRVSSLFEGRLKVLT